MGGWDKRILIIDEAGFSRVCSAILEDEGYRTEILTGRHNIATGLKNNEFGLVIASYPYGAYIIDQIKNRNIPTIILSDQINVELINMLECFNRTFCMIKPLDFRKFRSLVRDVMNGDSTLKGGYTIV